MPRVSTNPYAKTKQPAQIADTNLLKVPKSAESIPSEENDRKVRFRFGLVDHDCDWALLDISREDHRELLDFMANIEKMTAGELFKPGHRLCKTYADMSDCPNSEVPKRLAQRYEGLDYMVRLEVTGVKRLYGVRAGNEFHVVWWDPNHQVWPSTLRNT